MCDLTHPARERRLIELCGNNLELRRAVERLLQNDVMESPFEDDVALEDFGPGSRYIPATDEWIGKTIQSYKIREWLGEGGMGVVYRGEDLRLKRDVAIKFPSAPLLGDELERERFLSEARAAAALDHPSICKVFGIGETAGRPYIVSAYIEGESLAEVIRRGRLAPLAAIEYRVQLAEALLLCHSR